MTWEDAVFGYLLIGYGFYFLIELDLEDAALWPIYVLVKLIYNVKKALTL